MAHVNGSPFASAFTFDVARTGSRRLALCRYILALAFERAAAPLQHIDPVLGQVWPVPFYEKALLFYSSLAKGRLAPEDRLSHQAPTCFRVIPNLTAVALEAIEAIEKLARINLHAVKDNPNFMPDTHQILSSAGYHDNFAARKIDGVNAAFADMVFLIVKQVNHFIAGSSLHRPLYFGKGRTAGVEYLAWTLNDAIRLARESSLPTGIDCGEDPGGNQSDVLAPGFVSYRKFLLVSDALDKAMGALLVAACLSAGETQQSLSDSKMQPPELLPLCAWLAKTLGEDLGGAEPARLVSEPLRALIDEIRAMAVGEDGTARE